jgi:hypothetical protein
MPRIREHGDGDAPGGRWQRRALRRAAERRRIPKHGKTYVTLVEQMLAQRAKESAASASPAAGMPGDPLPTSAPAPRRRRLRPPSG